MIYYYFTVDMNILPDVLEIQIKSLILHEIYNLTTKS
jgi:hypothetical protein